MLPISLLYPATDDPVAFVEADRDRARKRFSLVRNDPGRIQHSKLVLRARLEGQR